MQQEGKLGSLVWREQFVLIIATLISIVHLLVCAGAKTHKLNYKLVMDHPFVKSALSVLPIFNL